MGIIPVNQTWNVKDKSFTRQLYQNFNNVSLFMSTLQSGVFSKISTERGIKLYPERNEATAVKGQSFHITELKNAAGTDTTAHGLTFARIFRVWGSANDTTAGSYLPIPYPSATAADIIEISVDDTNISITVGKDMSAYEADIHIEYLLV